MKPLVLAIALALATPLCALAQSQTSAAPTASAAVKPSPAWVDKSNEYAMVLIKAQAAFAPEGFSFFGIPGYDDQVTDLNPGTTERFRAATAAAKTQLEQKLQTERDPNVRQDLEILIGAAADAIETSEINERLALAYTDAPQLVFTGMQGLLSKQTPADRQAKAVDRLKRYVGMTAGTTPLMTLARQRYEERMGDKALVRPTKLEVDQALQNVDTYAAGVRKLFAEFKIGGADEALNALDKQMKDYASWTRTTVLPTARNDTKLPPDLYANQLKQIGIDIDPKLLMQRAQLEFMETRAAMQEIAPLVAKQKNIAAIDYRDVIRALKKDSIPNDKLEAAYRTVID
ncbi:MAG: DUF885 family protein, partial [Luteimonas sp.]